MFLNAFSKHSIDTGASIEYGLVLHSLNTLHCFRLLASHLLGSFCLVKKMETAKDLSSIISSVISSLICSYIWIVWAYNFINYLLVFAFGHSNFKSRRVPWVFHYSFGSFCGSASSLWKTFYSLTAFQRVMINTFLGSFETRLQTMIKFLLCRISITPVHS